MERLGPARPTGRTAGPRRTRYVPKYQIKGPARTPSGPEPTPRDLISSRSDATSGNPQTAGSLSQEIRWSNCYWARSAASTLQGPPSALSCVIENSRPRTTVLPGDTGWWMATPRLSCGLAGSPLIWQDTTTFCNGNGLSFLRVRSTINSFRDCRHVCSITDNLPTRSCAVCAG
jgi:hypothetical protein